MPGGGSEGNNPIFCPQRAHIQGSGGDRADSLRSASAWLVQA